MKLNILNNFSICFFIIIIIFIIINFILFLRHVSGFFLVFFHFGTKSHYKNGK